MNRTIIVAVLAVACLAAVAGPAQAKVGLALTGAVPTSEFGDRVKTGIGIHAVLKHPVSPLFDVTSDFGYTNFKSKISDGEVGDGGGRDVWNLSIGGAFKVGGIGLGLEYGRFWEVDDWSFVPSAAIMLGPLELALRYKAGGDAKWFEGRVGFYF